MPASKKSEVILSVKLILSEYLLSTALAVFSCPISLCMTLCFSHNLQRWEVCLAVRAKQRAVENGKRELLNPYQICQNLKVT